MKLFLTAILSFISIVISAQPFTQNTKFQLNTPSTSDFFGFTSSIYNNIAVSGAYQNDLDTNGLNTISNSGIVDVYERDVCGTWDLVQKIQSPVRRTDDRFGSSVFIYKDYLIIGCQNNDYSANESTLIANNIGAVYIYKRSATSHRWIFMQKIIQNDPFASDSFGSRITMIDGKIFVYAANDYDASGLNFITNAGAAYVFELNGSNVWVQVQKIVATDRTAGNLFGFSLVAEGNNLFLASSVNSYNNGMTTFSTSGSVYFFTYNGTNYVFNQKFSAPDVTASIRFGSALQLQNNRLIVGAEQSNTNLAGAAFVPAKSPGAAYAYTVGSGTISFNQKIVNPEAINGDVFGSSLALDGNTLIVGANGNDTDAAVLNSLSSAGACFVYAFDGTNWNYSQKIIASDRAASDLFGQSVGISGTSVIVGAYQNDPGGIANSGAAYLFENSSYPILSASLSTNLGNTVCVNESNSIVTLTGFHAVAPYNFIYSVNGGANQTDASYLSDTIQIPVNASTTGTYNLNLSQISTNPFGCVENPNLSILIDIVDCTALGIDEAVITANRKGEEADVFWYTTNENNISTHTLQRAHENGNFHDINIQNSKGNSSYNEYRFIDENFSKVEKNYYRVKLVNLNGNVSYSPIALLNDMEFDVFMYPNPAQDFISLICDKDFETLDFKLYTTDGKLVKAHMFQKQDELKVNVSDLAIGFYTFFFSDNLGNIVYKSLEIVN